MAPVQEANSDNLGKSFRFSTQVDEVILSTHNIQFHDKKISLNICFLELSEEFCRDSKLVRISHGKRAIGV